MLCGGGRRTPTPRHQPCYRLTQGATRRRGPMMEPAPLQLLSLFLPLFTQPRRRAFLHQACLDRRKLDGEL